VFAGDVGREVLEADHPGDQCAVDDRSAPARDHPRDLTAHAEPGAGEIDGEGTCPVGVGALGRRRRVTLDARVVEGDVEAAKVTSVAVRKAATASASAISAV
jgi:hypothetical protein